MTRVLAVDHTALVSGAQRALVETVSAPGDEVDFEVLCPPGPLADELRAAGITVHRFRGTSGSLRLHPVRTARAVADIARSAVALRAVARRRRIEVVHANSVRAGLIAVLAARLGAPPVVTQVHDCLPDTRAARIVRRVLVRGSAAIVAVSEYAARAFVTGLEPAPVDVLYNPIDLRRFDRSACSRERARAALDLEPDCPLVGVVAQITPWKGQDVAIRAFRAVVDRLPDARLVLVGEVRFAGDDVRFDNPAYRAGLERLVAELGLAERVDFWGQRDDVPTVVAALDVVALPSWEEPMGRIVLEARAMGTPVVVTAVGGAAELVQDGVDGLVVDPHDPPAWSAALLRLLLDPDERRSFGARGSVAVRRFAQEEFVARLEAVYRRVLGSPR